MELRQLEYFVTVSQLGSFTRAAEKLYVTQPSITNAIHKLEKELGIQLFDRSQKKPILTSEGMLFFNGIKPILSDITSVLKKLDDLKTLSQGTIKIAIPPIIGTYLFPRIFSAFHIRYPNLKLTLNEEGSWTSREMIECGDLDLGIIIVPADSELLEYKLLIKIPLIVCVSKSHPFATLKNISFPELANERLILLKKDSYQHHFIMQQFASLSINPNIVLTSGQVPTIKALVKQNVGISIIMDIVAENDSDLVCIPFNPPITIPIGVAWRKGCSLSKAAHAFIDFAYENSQYKILRAR